MPCVIDDLDEGVRLGGVRIVYEYFTSTAKVRWVVGFDCCYMVGQGSLRRFLFERVSWGPEVVRMPLRLWA